MAYYSDEYERRREIVRQRKRKRRIKRRIKWLLTKIIPVILVLLAVIVLSVVGISKVVNTILGDETIETTETDTNGKKDISAELKKANEELEKQNQLKREEEEKRIAEEEAAAIAAKKFVPEDAETMQRISDEVNSSNVILVDVSAEKVIADRGARSRIIPASMTKVLTVLTAAESLKDMSQLDDKFTITIDITDFAYSNDCSSVGFMENEEVTVRDLFYGTILPSGGDAALALAIYTAGSHEAFVDMMNEKVEQLGLSATSHFTNCVGLYDDNLYTTPYDLAIIMKAAMDNELCKEVMSTKLYTTTKTAEHPDGLEISNWFLRRIEDKDCGKTVLCAKTGYVKESGNCAVSYAEGEDSKGYICVTANAHSNWRCIYDHVAIYKDLS